MDREILFRGKTKDGRWVYGDLVRRLVETTWQDILGEYQFAIAGTGEREKTVDFKNKRAEVISCTTVDPATVGQYTGLCDKDGVKIFEGDIVREHANDYTPIYQNGIYMAYNVDKINDPYVSTQFNVIWRNGCEVIGNIHDNPELMGEKK